MPRGALSPAPSRHDLELEPCDIEILAYIQSNKFITTRLFHKRFLPNKSYMTACTHLKDLVDRGLLLKTQKLPCEDTFFYLTRPAIRQLYALARILVSREVRSPHINIYEREHDKRVIQMRIQIEAESALANLTWLSDYEMRCGLKMDWKKALQEGRGWDLSKAKLHRFHHRTPDGYFEATIEGASYTFVLEYEHTPYKREKMAAMVLNLNYNFPGVVKLIVSRDKDHAIRMARGLVGYLRANPRELPLWAFSFYQKVANLPFTRVPWATLEGKYLPFVKDPIMTKDRPEADSDEVNS
ncbi:MAG: hypothetical protein JXL84_24505 [Deltaproteobacteria bacterium]|nr:hypothetical protein [Deltaproteobacteria bacterium]